jgi:hypothetical protein
MKVSNHQERQRHDGEIVTPFNRSTESPAECPNAAGAASEDSQAAFASKA